MSPTASGWHGSCGHAYPPPMGRGRAPLLPRPRTPPSRASTMSSSGSTHTGRSSWVGVGTTEQVLGALLRHAQVVVRSADRRWEFKILNLLEFNSKRKRMTVILQNEDGQFFLYCKGADRLSMLRKPKAYRCEQGIGCDISCQMGTNKHNICSPS